LILWLISWVLVMPFAFGSEWAWTGYFFPLAVWWMLRSKTAYADTWLAELWRVGRKVFNS